MKIPVWVVKEVKPQTDYTLLLTFASGEKRIYDVSPLLETAIFADLKNKVFFMKAKAEHGTVMWNDDIDLCPEALYTDSCPIE